MGARGFTSVRWVAVAAVLAAVVSACVVVQPPPSTTTTTVPTTTSTSTTTTSIPSSIPTVSGGGDSFPALELNQWRADVARPPYNLSINYTAAGSTYGRQQYLQGNVDFAVSDIQFQLREQAAVDSSPRKDFVYVPVSAGALGLMYNLIGTDGQRVTDLRFTREALCRIFTEPGIKWNDPGIAATNPGVPLPDRNVRPVIRSDSSGTSYVFSEFCIATSPNVWGRFVALVTTRAPELGNVDFDQAKPTSNWPVLSGLKSDVPAFASDGVANTIRSETSGRDTIGYIEAGYATKVGLPTALVQNAAGQFVPPNPPNSTVALGYATGRPNGTFFLDYDGPDPRAYFPSTYSYVIAQTTGFDPAKGWVLGTFLNYAVTKGQDRAEPLLYARLPTEVVNLALDSIQKIPGAPPPPNPGDPPPPSRECHDGGGGLSDIELIADYGVLGNALQWSSSDGTCSGEILGGRHLVLFTPGPAGDENASAAAACAAEFPLFVPATRLERIYRSPLDDSYPTLPLSTAGCLVE